ncbi:unnamed protein product [Ranitomeya imitator]|uniref:Uncharacterized protein n=1 Tax=Ranitomeya imitator TaxID=111125 RepID=A0ABN9KSU6_9NEOB|nr:unnamed protein product [Ranitomeya imitator]
MTWLVRALCLNSHCRDPEDTAARGGGTGAGEYRKFRGPEPVATLAPGSQRQETPILLTPNAMLSSIHFWSTLSPVASLSPARLHGSSLFQFPSVYNSHMPLALSGFDSPSTPGPFSPDLQKS